MKTLDFFQRRRAVIEQQVVRPMIATLQFGRFILPIVRSDAWVFTWYWPETTVRFEEDPHADRRSR